MRAGKRSIRGVEWATHRIAVVAATATVTGLAVIAPAQALAQIPAGTTFRSPSATMTVLVTSRNRPDHYDPVTVGNVLAGEQSGAKRSATTDAVHVKTAMHSHVSQDLAVANGVVAQVTPDDLAALRADPTLVVTPDVPVTVKDGSFVARDPAAVFPTTTGATQLAKGLDGSGVTVAVLDTGITKLPDFGPRLVGGVDLSGEGNPYQDSYGHGTFVAGLIAGNGASSKGVYKGEAPGAKLVSVKVAGVTGVTDVATVISGINWVVSHQDQFKIGVLNISLGAIPTTSTVLNPLDQAVETAWQAGITVVTSAGNSGPFNGTIVSPGDDPLAITAGALDDQGSTDPAAATATDFSSVGPTNIDGWFKPDLVTSGRSVVSLRAPGSTIDKAFPSARIGAANFVGSGTSFSAAITSGAAALVIDGVQTNAKTTPTSDTVKAQLLGTTSPGPVGNPMVDGHGALNVLAAVTHPGLKLTQTAPTVATPVGSTVDLGTTWNGSSWNGSSWNGSSWNGSTWNGSSWNGSSWNGSSWNGSSWNGSSWNGSSWNGSSWNGSTWS
jgi:serine protease AprX